MSTDADGFVVLYTTLTFLGSHFRGSIDAGSYIISVTDSGFSFNHKGQMVLLECQNSGEFLLHFQKMVSYQTQSHKIDFVRQLFISK